MSSFVSIDGSGVAAVCCARLLQMQGATTSIAQAVRSHGPVLMLSDQTQKLLKDVFGPEPLSPGAHHVRRRIVLWGKHAQVVAFPHSGLVMSEATLLSRLWAATSPAPSSRPDLAPDWQINSSQKFRATDAHHFGSRIANASTVKFKAGALQDACWMESIKTGWLFLLPCGNGTGSLISVGGQPATLVAESSLISDQIESIEETPSRFAAYPRVTTPLCGDGWIACGTAALAFDPICGEGTGNAVREAILASAVISAAVKGLDSGELLALYSTRLLTGFLRHLELCLEFYRSACRSDWWQMEMTYLEEGIAWCQGQLNDAAPYRFRLTGFELQQVG